MRSYRSAVIRDNAGNAIDDAAVEVREFGTTTPVTDLFIDETGGSALSPPVRLTKDGGHVEFWLAVPRDITLYVTDNNDSAHYAGQSTPLSFNPWTQNSRATRAADAIFIPSGSISATNVQDALTEEHSERVAADATLTTDVAARIPLTQKGQANGVAPLDAGGKVPGTHLPAPPGDAVTSVNGEVGAVVLDADDVGAATPDALAADALVNARDVNDLYDTIDRLYGGYALDTTFVDLGVPPAVAAQSSAFGRRIHGLKDFDGRMFYEFGDWINNTGPCPLECWNPATSAFEEEHELATEQIRYRVVDSALWALCLDPSGTNPPSYARRVAGSTAWTDVALPIEPIHVFDIAEMDSVLYLATQTDDPASSSFDATIWASDDDGATWTDIKRFPSINTPPNTAGSARAWMLLVLDGFLYVEPFHSSLRPEPGTRGVAERFDGTTWDEAPSMLTPTQDVGWDGFEGPVGHKATPFTTGPNVGWVMYLGHPRSRTRVTTLNAYNGSERVVLRRGVRDFALHSGGQRVYVIDALGRMDTHVDFNASVEDMTWRASRSGPTVSVENAYSLGLIGTTAYIGTTGGPTEGGHLWRGSAV